jgi:hypothetical protein
VAARRVARHFDPQIKILTARFEDIDDALRVDVASHEMPTDFPAETETSLEVDRRSGFERGKIRESARLLQHIEGQCVRVPSRGSQTATVDRNAVAWAEVDQRQPGSNRETPRLRHRLEANHLSGFLDDGRGDN